MSPTPPSSTSWWRPPMRSCTTPRNHTTTTPCTTPQPFLHTNLIGTFTLSGGGHASTAPGFTTSPPTRCTATWRSTIRQVHRIHPLQPVLAVLLDEGRQRSVGASVGPVFRGRSDDFELLQQLRSIPTRREVHSPPDHQHPAGYSPQAVRRGPQRARLDPRRRPLVGSAVRSWKRAESERRTSSAPTAKRTTRPSSN